MSPSDKEFLGEALPAIVTVEQGAILLGLPVYAISVLIRRKILRALGNPKPNAPKRLATITLLQHCRDPIWLDKAISILTRENLLKRQHGSGNMRKIKDPKIGKSNSRFCVEDSDEELAPDCRLEHGKHHRIHICRCRKVAVGVIFNGVTKTESFPPSTTLRKVVEWARDKFGVDKKEKLVLRLGSTESEPLDPDSHVGSYVSHPHCQVTFYLTPKIKIEG